MGNEKNKFNALTPEVLNENKQIYTEALDYAFGNSDIKNIAITGIYGAGKSTVWNTYIHEKDLNNVITVSLGKYKDDNIESLENNGDDNRVERQLINQILSQIKSSEIPLSKYGFKSNKSILKICIQSLAFLSMMCSILLWITRNTFLSFMNFDGATLIYLCAVLLFVPSFYYLYSFFRGNKFRISKIAFKGAEANVSDDKSDESVLDRDMMELVYLLRSSGSKIVVFEDLDRYNSTSIYSKLRELNFLLNHYVKMSGDNTPVRFVYMLKDSLFFSKNRTKFFDFILPIVPVVDSKTSENELIELFKAVENAPNSDVLADISLYVDDMRLLKNIVNEYIVYSKIIPLGKIDLDRNKLFALITLKNIFPNEFDLLQEDKGFVRTVFDRLESNKRVMAQKLKMYLEKIDNDIEFINSRIENDKFEAMALIIPADVRPDSSQNKTMPEFLKDWSHRPKDSFNFSYSYGSRSFEYNDFIEQYISNDDEKKSLVDRFPEDFSIEISKLNSEKRKIQKQIKDIEMYSYKELISMMTATEKDELFSIDSFDIFGSHYFPLIRVLILEGLLDETYWYYKGNFNVDKSNTLKRNDTIYVKGLKEGKELDIFLDVETPEQIINRLKLADFNRSNILNKKVLKSCIEKNMTKYIMAIADSVDANNNYEDLVKILDEFDLELVRKYSDMLINDKSDKLVSIMECCETGSDGTFKNILISVATNKTIALDYLVLFKEYFEQNENIIALIPEEQFDIFIDNIRSAGIKFVDMSEANCDRARLIAVEELQAYKLNIKNLVFVAKVILEKSINYGRLLSEVYGASQLSSSRQYIDDNFSGVVAHYIDENKEEQSYTNSEEILLKILNSNISNEHKLGYVEKNETVISKLANLKSGAVATKILDCLLRKNKVKFCSENITAYWNMIDEYSDEFIDYLDNNLDETNYEGVLSNNISICNTFINSPWVSDKVFAFVIKYANEPISNIDSELTQTRINTLIHNRLVEVTENNIEVLMDKAYNIELTLLANGDEEIEDTVINTLLKYEPSDELIYSLVNSEISDENALKLINLIESSVLVERINPNKHAIIKAIINGNLSSKNISYICESFDSFELKDEFIESLDDEDKLEKLEDEYLNETFMKYVVNASKIRTDTKVSLIKTKIHNHADIKTLREYISSIPNIAELSNVWEGKYPLLDNAYKKSVGEALKSAGYVKNRNGKESQRIMLVNQSRNNTVEEHLL